MNRPSSNRYSLTQLLRSTLHHRGLIARLVKREIQTRYRGSVLGIAWSFVNPIFMLGVYTLLFSGVFQVRRGATSDLSHTEYAVVLFLGLIIHSLASECINRAPQLVLSNVNYVKKVIFPLETLPFVVLGSALFNAAVAIFVLLVFEIAVYHRIPMTGFLIPVVIAPLLILLVGTVWILAAFGVYIRDIAQATGMLSTILLFASPVFYSRESLPPDLQKVALLNPLTLIIEESRHVLINGILPAWSYLGIYFAISCVVAALGFVIFQRARRGFADVL